MWETLDLVRVYTKPRGLPPDYSQPVVLRHGKCSVEDFCNAIHKEIAKQMKYAIVWGASAKHSRGQKVGLDHILEDEDGEFLLFLAFENYSHLPISCAYLEEVILPHLGTPLSVHI